MALDRSVDVVVPGGSIRRLSPSLRERAVTSPQRPLGIAWGRILLVLSLALGLWALLAEAAALLLG